MYLQGSKNKWACENFKRIIDHLSFMNITIENFIPHRARMKLIEGVVEVGNHTATTEATVTNRWPLIYSNSVHPIVIIELVAQTSGIIGGLENEKKGNRGTKGWIVGIKKASFYTKSIPLGSRIVTRATNRFVGYGNFIEVEGISQIGSECIGEVILQVIDDDKEYRNSDDA